MQRLDSDATLRSPSVLPSSGEIQLSAASAPGADDHGRSRVVSHDARSSSQPSSSTADVGEQLHQEFCTGCGKPITERYLLKVMEQFWHEDCLKCSCCDCRLGEVGSTLFTKANLLLCRRDYLRKADKELDKRLFGATGYCSACSKMIPAFEMVMKAKGNVYHLECFACQECNHRFCIGDRYYLCDNKILCEFDYEERVVFARISHGYNALSPLKRQTQGVMNGGGGRGAQGGSGVGGMVTGNQGGMTTTTPTNCNNGIASQTNINRL